MSNNQKLHIEFELEQLEDYLEELKADLELSEIELKTVQKSEGVTKEVWEVIYGENAPNFKSTEAFTIERYKKFNRSNLAFEGYIYCAHCDAVYENKLNDNPYWLSKAPVRF